MGSSDEMKVRIDWLRWIIDFSNADLGTLTEEEKLRLFFRLENMVFYAINFSKSGGVDYEKVKEDWFKKDFNESKSNILANISAFIQHEFRFILTYIINSLESSSRHSSIPITKKPSMPNGNKNYLGRIRLSTMDSILAIFPDQIKLDIIYDPPNEDSKNPKIREYYLQSLRSIYEEAKNYLKKDSLLPGNEIESQEILWLSRHLYFYNCFRLLNGIPSKWIQKCKGCSHFFLNPTRIEKMYCTSSCASRSIARAKREELRKDSRKYRAFLDKQKRYMRKRYEEKRKASLGPNVKVGRKEG